LIRKVKGRMKIGYAKVNIFTKKKRKRKLPRLEGWISALHSRIMKMVYGRSSRWMLMTDQRSPYR
jgi:hypothetical protein